MGIIRSPLSILVRHRNTLLFQGGTGKNRRSIVGPNPVQEYRVRRNNGAASTPRKLSAVLPKHRRSSSQKPIIVRLCLLFMLIGDMTTSGFRRDKNLLVNLRG